MDAIHTTLVAGLLYFLPAVVAALRRHPSGLAIFLLDLLLGWTVLGWIVALIWSASGERGGAVSATPLQPRRTCPYCAEPILPAAIKCKHCGEALEPPTQNGADPHVGADGYQIGRGVGRFLRKD